MHSNGLLDWQSFRQFRGVIKMPCLFQSVYLRVKSPVLFEYSSANTQQVISIKLR